MQKSVIMNSNEINKSVIDNVLLMLLRRKQLNKKTFDIYKNKKKNDTIFDVKNEDNKKFSIYILNSIINSIISKSNLDEFLSENLDIRKIVIIKEPSKRAVKQLLKSYTNAEFFFMHEMLDDIPSKSFIPKHILLSEEDKEKLLTKIKLNVFSKIRKYDPMARYFNAKENDIFKIIRPNITTLEESFYRVVIDDKIDNMFL